MSFTRIVTAASYLPALVVDNDQLSAIMDTSDEWIYTRTGIKRRHLATDQNTSDLALEVAKKLLANSQLDPADLDLIVVATMSPDAATPSTAAIIQGKLGAKTRPPSTSRLPARVCLCLRPCRQDAGRRAKVLSSRRRSLEQAARLGRPVDGGPLWRRGRGCLT